VSTYIEGDYRLDTSQGQAYHKDYPQLLNSVVVVKTHLKISKRGHVVLFSTDLNLTAVQIVDYSRLRFQIEINYPAASSGVLKELELSIFMELFISLTLFLDVMSDGVFITMFADRTGKVTVCPKFAPPQLFLDLRTLAKDFPCGQALDQRYNFRDRVGWYGLD
jgi:putative transposase